MNDFHAHSLTAANLMAGLTNQRIGNSLLTGGPNYSNEQARHFISEANGYDFHHGAPGLGLPSNMDFFPGLNGSINPLQELATVMNGRTTGTGQTNSVPDLNTAIDCTLGNQVNQYNITHGHFVCAFAPDPNAPENTLVGDMPYINACFANSQKLFSQALQTEMNNATGRPIDPLSQAHYQNSLDPKSLMDLRENLLYIVDTNMAEALMRPLGYTVAANKQATFQQRNPMDPYHLIFKNFGRMNIANAYGKAPISAPFGHAIFRANTGCEFTDLSETSSNPLIMAPVILRQKAPCYFTSPDPIVNLERCVRESNEVRAELFGANQEWSFLRGGLSDQHAGFGTYLVGNTEPRLMQGPMTDASLERRKPLQEEVAEYDLAFFEPIWRSVKKGQEGLREYDPAAPFVRTNATGPERDEIWVMTRMMTAVQYYPGYVIRNPMVSDCGAWGDEDDHRTLMYDRSLEHAATMTQRLEVMMCQ